MFHYSSYFDPSIGYLQAYQFPGFTKTNFVASYEFWRSETKSARFYAKVDNLFDQTFYVAGFLAPRTTVMGGVGYAF
jgi:outer membrane receptor protein involved in Fe transport